jgi:hypothetical protein
VTSPSAPRMPSARDPCTATSLGSPAASTPFICPQCNVFIAEPWRSRRGQFSCPLGHKVYPAPARAGLVASGLVAGSCVCLLTWYVPGWIPALYSLAMLVRVLTVVSFGWGTFKGLWWFAKPVPTRLLGIERVVGGLSGLVGLAVTAWALRVH